MYWIDRLRPGGGATRWACEGLTEVGLDLAWDLGAALASVGVSVARTLALLAWASGEDAGSVSAWGGDLGRRSARSTLMCVSLAATLCSPLIGRFGMRDLISLLRVVGDLQMSPEFNEARTHRPGPIQQVKYAVRRLVTLGMPPKDS